jgi:tRNA 5-methylaminomethyl-2-thiouridine biosynthesis bifunctional protein
MRFHTDAYAFLLHQLKHLKLTSSCRFNDCGVLQLTHNRYPESEHYQLLNAEQGSRLAGVEINCRSLYFANSGSLNPAKLCRELVKHPLVAFEPGTRVHEIQPCKQQFDAKPAQEKGWRLHCAGDRTIHTRQIVLANSHTISQFAQTAHLPLIPARGQISRFGLIDPSSTPQCIISGRHYVIPDGRTVLTGATFERDTRDNMIRDCDHRSNLAGLSALFPNLSVNPMAVDGWAGVRATTPDRLPLVGPLADYSATQQVYASIRHGLPLKNYPSLPQIGGLFVLGGLGSRGIVTAPLAAKALADFLTAGNTGCDGGLLRQWVHLVNPVRFQIRALKRRYT